MQFIVERRSAGVQYALVRYADGSLDHRPSGGYPDQPPHHVVWSGDLADLGEGWEYTDDDSRLTDDDAAYAAELLNEDDGEQ
ncbi:hypothetical protein [Streptomyces sp. NPDC058657]|uniref:hypothetical protein n=1 Tax=unclassified Streptomyces TaxID=2593676 RepID=UPI0036623665